MTRAARDERGAFGEHEPCCPARPHELSAGRELQVPYPVGARRNGERDVSTISLRPVSGAVSSGTLTLSGLPPR